MPEVESWIDRFITYLETLRENKNRGALAALRRGLGSPPGTVPGMYPYILPWSPPNKYAEDSCYIIGSLFAFHIEPGGNGTIGNAFSMVKEPNESLEKRFVALLNCHREDLPNYLRQAIGLLKAKDIPIDWRQLLRDVYYWNHETRFIQQQWARDYWRKRALKTEPEEVQMTTS